MSGEGDKVSTPGHGGRALQPAWCFTFPFEKGWGCDFRRDASPFLLDSVSDKSSSPTCCKEEGASVPHILHLSFMPAAKGLSPVINNAL